MNQNDKRLTKYIDQLNADIMPMEHRMDVGSEEMDQLMSTVRKVRSLKEPNMPEVDFEKKLLTALKSEYKDEPKISLSSEQRILHSKFIKRSILGITAVAAAAVILFAIPNITLPGNHTNIAYAMEQALKELHAYHGIIEVVETNQLGETMLQSKREVWADKKGNYYVKDLEGYSKGMITVNNTKKEWQIRPEEQKVYQFTGFPDPYRFTFEIGSEVEEVKNALSVKDIGEVVIAGRTARLLEVEPKGGDPYRLWIDKETDLPLQRESAMQNALQYRVTYTQIEFLDVIPVELLICNIPDGYEVVETNPEQIVATTQEAEKLTSLKPTILKNIPESYVFKGIAVLTQTNMIKSYYETADLAQKVVILQKKATQEMKPASDAVLGSVSNNPAEILSNYEGISGVNSIRWQEAGMEYTVFGNISTDQLTSFVKGITSGDVLLPSDEAIAAHKPQIEVPVDMEAEENEQKSVDAGHSPWKLDPVFVTQVFSSLLLSPEGIVGEYPIPYDAITITENNGSEAVAIINSENTIAEYVYLKRLVRQDDTGIWTVIGYDPVKK
jgi:outer membrane lipoprotein-sorting protein